MTWADNYNLGSTLVTFDNVYDAANALAADQNTAIFTGVSNTTSAPINCANVRILLSTDGGFTYPVVLAASVPNNGSASISVPNNLSNTCRVKVEAIGNIFFDISNTNFRIQLPPVPTFSLNTSVGSVQACAGDTVAFTANLLSILGFSDPVQLTVTGAPAGAVVQVDPNPGTPGSNATVRLSGLTPAMAGNYALTVQGVAGSITQSATVQLNLLPGKPATPAIISPVHGASGQPLNAVLTWNSAPFATSYQVEVSASPAFTSLILNQTTTSASLQTPALLAGTVYYWRLRAANSCGTSTFSPVYAFQTGNLNCNQVFNSADVPKDLPLTVGTTVSVLNVPDNKNIADVDVTLIANHTYVGDLTAWLVSPANDTVLLFDRPGVPTSLFGCSGNNLTLIFNDAAAQTAATLESTCSGVTPALLGEFQSVGLLSKMNGKSAQGEWKILVADAVADDGGTIIAWGLTFCFADAVPPGTIVQNPLTVASAGSGTIGAANLSFTLSGQPDQSKFTLLSLPQHGTLTLNGAPMALGDIFSQSDINDDFLVYTHNGDNAAADEFNFDAVDLNNFAWVNDETFHIVIVQNNLAATAAQTQGILCHNGATGQITVAASGLNGQYQYSLNGGASQSSNVFSGLQAGSYTVVVTGQLGFTATSNTIVIGNPAALSVSTTVAGDEVTVTASGGTGTLEYSIDGTNFQPSNVFGSLANGIYTVIVVDANGCSATAQAIVAVNSLLATLGVQAQVSCFGGNNGVVVATVGGGQAPFSYSLNGGTFQPGNTFSGLSAGEYTVAVMDNQGFSVTTNVVTLSSPPAINVVANANLNAVIVTALGGTGTLEYSLDGSVFQASNTFPGLANGDYTVTIRDANGCTATAQVTVDVPPLNIVSVNTSGAILCFGDTSATIEVNAAGGVPPYEYALDFGPYQSGSVFSGVGGGGHFVEVRDAQGMVVQSNAFFIDQPTPLAAVADVNGNDVQFLFIGGTPPYTFAYNGPLPPVNLPNGDYVLSVTDGNGCLAIDSFSVSLPPLIASVLVVDLDPCDESIQIQVVASGGEAPYEYSLNGGPFQSGNEFSVFSGTSNVRVRDVTGAVIQVPVNVNIPTPVSLTASSSGDTITAAGAFGTTPYLYSIDGVNFQTSGVFPDLPNGTYTVTVQDLNGCIDTAQVVVSSIGTVEPGMQWGLTVAPNPGSGLFQLTMQQAPPALRAEVFDAAGRIVRTLDLNPAGGTFQTILDLQNFPQGTYLLRLTDGQNWGSVRLSVIR